MSIRTQISALWKDPVGSNLIAGAIIAAGGYLYVRLAPGGALSSHPLAKVGIPTLGLAIILLLWRRHRRSYKTLVFVSSGGTCRDPIAKTIATRVIEGRTLGPRIKVRAAGLGPLSSGQASYAARYVFREMYGDDLLKDHRPELLTPELVEQADLILVMDEKLLLTPGKTLPKEKTFLLKEFFGMHGDVIDPWPDGKDAATIQRYRKCAQELKSILETHPDKVIAVLKI
jgi:protein-tyrosine-phosphatase